jgi:hypothetical protein
MGEPLWPVWPRWRTQALASEFSAGFLSDLSSRETHGPIRKIRSAGIHPGFFKSV